MSACPSCGVELAGSPTFCPECGTRLGLVAVRSDSRRVVTILFSDMTGSTALGERLDPETVRALMGRYFGAMRAVIEGHGGSVEKYIGDAVMAVFGIPTLHEDDALRAVRAAAQMREALAALNAALAIERGVTIETRTGITTGEVVAGDPAAGHTLVTGDTVNTAARLEQAAAAGEILIGEPTWRLVRDAVSAEPVASVNAKGKALPVPAYRLDSVAVGAEGHGRWLDGPLIGRERELARLTQSFADAVSQRRCELFTLLGAAGVGKSRLVREFLATVAGEARILRGRCLPYGEGIAYWPLAEALREAAGIVNADDRAAAQSKLDALLAGERHAELITPRLATAIGLSDEPAPQAELFWAVRRCFEQLARGRSVVVVWEDIHWAEPTFLDLIDHLAGASRDLPLLILCTARIELFDGRPGWSGGKLNATSLLLEPLPTAVVGQLIDAQPGAPGLASSIRERVVQSAAGNPLFVEELIGMLVDDGVIGVTGRHSGPVDIDRLAIPATITAVLGARLGRLSPAELQVIQRAAVVGPLIDAAVVVELVSDRLRADVPELLSTLVAKELLRREPSQLTAGDAFQFRHILVREVAYGTVPKRDRAALHERVADWLAGTAAEGRTDADGMIGYHLEQANRYYAELGDRTAMQRGIPERAAAALASAGLAALRRDDVPASVELLTRASSLLSRGTQQRLEIIPHLAHALTDAGSSDQAAAYLDESVIEATAAGDARVASHALVARARIGRSRATTSNAEADSVARAAIAAFTAARDELGLARAWLLIAETAASRKAGREELRAGTEAVLHAVRCGSLREHAEALRHVIRGAAWGPDPLLEALAQCQEALTNDTQNRRLTAEAFDILAQLKAVEGDFEEARRLNQEALAVADELRLPALTTGYAWSRGWVEWYAEEWDAAEAFFRQAYIGARQSGDVGYVASLAACLADVVARQGREHEALALTRESETLAAEDDLDAQTAWRMARALVSSRTGATLESIDLARAALALIEPTDYLLTRAAFLADAAEVFRRAGETQEARTHLDAAVGLYELKGAHFQAQRVAQRLGPD